MVLPFTMKVLFAGMAKIKNIMRLATRTRTGVSNLPRINTIRDDQMVELAEFFGVNYRKDFLNL